VNYPLTTLTVSEDIFDGSLWLIDTSASGIEAGLRELGQRTVQLHVIEDEEVTTIIGEEEIIS
jgi:hypothetical protein